MRAELIPPHGLFAGHVPVDAPDDGQKIGAEHGPETHDMRQPPNHDREVLECVRKNSYSQGAVVFAARSDAPRYERPAPSRPANLKIVANAIDPPAEAALEHPAAVVVNLVP